MSAKVVSMHSWLFSTHFYSLSRTDVLLEYEVRKLNFQNFSRDAKARRYGFVTMLYGEEKAQAYKYQAKEDRDPISPRRLDTMAFLNCILVVMV